MTAGAVSRPGVLLAAGVLATSLLTMPAALYRGDANAARISAARWIEHGELALPEADAASIPEDFLSRRGQYFFHDSARHRYVTKYGVLSSLLHVPPLLAARVDLGAPLDPFPHGRRVVLWLNAWNALFAAAIAWQLYRLGLRFSPRPLHVIAVVLVVLYGSFAWYYLRAQTFEIFQVFFFTGFVRYLLEWNDERRPAAFWLAMVCGALLTWMKAYYGLVFPLAWLGLALGRPAPRRASALADGLRIGAVALLVGVVVLVENRVLFGSWLEFGYGQYAAPASFIRGRPIDNSFSLRWLPDGLHRLLLQPNRSVLLHFPPWVAAVAGAALGWRRQRPAVLVLALIAVAFLFLAAAQNGTGGWCLGPRYLVFVLPAAGMLAARTFPDEQGGRALRWLGPLALVVPGLVGYSWNVGINRFDFHADWMVREALARHRLEPVEEWFEGRHPGSVFADLRRLRDQGIPLPPIEIAIEAEPESRPRFLDMQAGIRDHPILRVNNWLLRGVRTSVADDPDDAPGPG